jgi:putative ABC transport system permease protein
MHGLRETARRVVRAKIFSLAVVLTLAIALVEVIVVATAVDRVLLRPLPFANSDRVMLLFEHGKGDACRLPSYETFRDWQAQSKTLAQVAFVRLRRSRMHTSDGPS